MNPIALCAFAMLAVIGILVYGIISARRAAQKASDDDEVSVNEVALNHEMDEFVRGLNANRAA
jgi:heme/copper-type cytochrome/quinol oxidase subunit 2